jgi:hypothetical protein
VYEGDGGIPAEYLGQQLTFEAFGENRERLAERCLHGGGE